MRKNCDWTGFVAAIVLTALQAAPCGAQIWGNNTGPGGGVVDDLVADPTRPGTVYASNPNELYRSDDAGQSWTTPASSGLTTYGLMVVDPTRGGALFMATSGGVYRSDDAGESWTMTYAGSFFAIAIDAATGTLYTGGRNGNGVFRSTDGGVTWVRVYDLRTSAILDDRAWIIRTDPLNPRFVYIVSLLDWFYVSEDGGDTWEERKDLYRVYRGDGLTFDAVGLELDAALDGVLYLAATDGVYRSENSGKGWSLASKGLPPGSTITGFAADRAASGVLYAATRYSGIYRSADGGGSWAWASTGLPWELNSLTGIPRTLTSMSADFVDPDRIYVGTEIGQVFVQLCGNAQVDAGEMCDDGNTAEGDGCSSRCRDERYLDTTEQRCVKGMNAKGLAIAKKQAKENLGCFDAGAGGSEADPQACLTADANGRIAAKRNALARAEARLCAVAPPYGTSSANDVTDAAVEEMAGLVGDIFGGDLTAAQIDPAVDPAGAACQRAVVDAAQRLMLAYAKTFFVCKKKRMKGAVSPTIGAADDLGDCLEEDHRRISKARSRLDHAPCSGVDTAVAFPNGYNGYAGPFGQFDFQARCRVCRMVNRMDGAAHDCDTFDHDEPGSCP